MTKAKLYTAIQNSKTATYTAKGYDQNQFMYDHIAMQIGLENKRRKSTGETPITFSFDNDGSVENGGVLQISNGQFFMFPKKPKTGAISVHSTYITVAGVRIEKKDIDVNTITEDSFKTVHGSTITF